MALRSGANGVLVGGFCFLVITLYAIGFFDSTSFIGSRSSAAYWSVSLPEPPLGVDCTRRGVSPSMRTFCNDGPRLHPEMTLEEARQAFFGHLDTINAEADGAGWYGSPGRVGGWNLCKNTPFNFTAGKCLVYDFGIDRLREFDDVMRDDFGCDVHVFDPTFEIPDKHKRKATSWLYKYLPGKKTHINRHGWKVVTFCDIVKELGHERRDIDVVVLDIAFYEWEALEGMLECPYLSNVKQLGVRLNAYTDVVAGRALTFRPAGSNPSEADMVYDYYQFWKVLQTLEVTGFRKRRRVTSFSNYCFGPEESKQTWCADPQVMYLNEKYVK